MAFKDTAASWEAAGRPGTLAQWDYDRTQESNQKKNATENMEKYGAGIFSIDPDIQRGQKTGLSRAKSLYGLDSSDIGEEIKMTRAMRKKRLEGKDPASTNLRDSRNRRLRMARARGASEQELAQIDRAAESDIGRSEADSQSQRLSEYERSITNALRGTAGLELGFGGLEKAGQQVAVPSSSGGLTVICTEMHRQGYMSDEILMKDRIHGLHIRRTNPDAYNGYILLASPVVELMKKSKVFSYLVSIPAMAWARDMAGQKSITGRLINKIGVPFCAMVWRARWKTIPYMIA